MKGQRELAFFVSLAVFLAAPYISGQLLKATVNSYVGVAALLLIVLVAVRQDMVVALAVFLAAGSLFLENRKRLVAGVGASDGAPTGGAPVETLDKPAEPIYEGEVHPEFEEPERESHPFEPTEETGSQDFKAVGVSINEKEPLETAPSNSSAAAAAAFRGL